LRDIARRALSALPGSGLILAGATGILLAFAGPAAAAAAPPTIAGAFTPTEIGVGDGTPTALSVTITNPNSSGTLSAVAFTDTLPAGLTIDNPNGQNGTCGSAGVITAAAGSSTLSLSGGSVKPATSCTISVAVIAAAPGTYTNTTGDVSSSAGTGAAGSPQTLTVLPAPTVSASGIKNDARFTFGQPVTPTFTCTQPGDPTALSDCSATDDLGNTIASGHRLDTRDPGQHTLTVTATSSDGVTSSAAYDYTVLPDNRFTVSDVTAKGGGALTLKLKLPGQGRVTVSETGPRRTRFAGFTRRVSDAASFTVRLTPTAAGRRLLAPVTVKKGKKKTTTIPTVKVTLTITFTPKGGVKKTITERGIVLKHA
jgi:hypothetical protein